MSNTRNLSNLLDSNGDVKATHLDNAPAPTKATIEGLGIAASSITGALPAIDGSNLSGINTDLVADTTPQLGGDLDCNGAQIQWSKGADVVSAAALPVLTDGNYFDVTGTTAVTSINTTGGAGTLIKLHFDAILTLTHHATDLILPGSANITTAAGDEAEFIEYAAGDYRCTSYSKASGTSVVCCVGSLASLSDTTVSASDPTVSANPSAVGHLWLNSTSGEQFIATNITAGANTWKNTGDGTVGVAPSALTSPTLNSPADNEPATNIAYTITSTDANDNKLIFDIQQSGATLVSVDSGTATAVSNTIEITGWSGSSVVLTLTFAEATYNNRVKAVDTNGVYPDSAWSSTDTIVIASPAYFGERGLNGGGADSIRNVIEYITIASAGNATDFGDLTQARSGLAGMSNGSRGVFTKGNFGTSGSGTTIDYVTVATTGNAIDFGDTSVGGDSSRASSDGTRGLIWNNGHSCTTRDQIEYITIATTGNTTDFGNASAAYTSRGGALGNSTRSICAGAWYCFTAVNIMDYVTYSTLGNASDFGDMQYANTTHTGTVSDGTRGIWGGTEWGTSSNWSNFGGMEYVTIATLGNSAGFGNFNPGNGDPYGHNGVSEPAACNNSTRGCWMGGKPYYSIRNNIDYITISTLGDATDFGDLTATCMAAGGLSGD